MSVRLAQSLAALRALAIGGIQRGRMILHARRVVIAVGATGGFIEVVAGRMAAEKAVRIDRAEEILREIKESKQK